jgi:F0F1-type ATP synthase membrane subunit a
MTKKTLYLVLSLIVIIFIINAIKGFLILSQPKQISTPIATTTTTTTTTTIPDNLSISDEIGG